MAGNHPTTSFLPLPMHWSRDCLLGRNRLPRRTVSTAAQSRESQIPNLGAQGKLSTR